MIQIPYEYSNIEKYNKGLTNDNYLLDINNTRYMLRYPKNDTKHLFDRNQEKEILKKLDKKPFVFHVFYYEEGIQLIEYYEDLVNFEDYKDNDKIKKVASLMKQLHEIKVDPELIFDPQPSLF